MRKKSLSYIDLFAGCGGMSLGLYESGLTGLFAIERNRTAFGTLKYNLIDARSHFDWPEWLPIKEYDINYVINHYSRKLSMMNKVDLVVGGPPCQGFSLAGRRNINDKRNLAVNSYIKFIKLVRPRALFFENVKGFTIGFRHGQSRGIPYSTYIKKELSMLGYDVEARLIDFSDFGVPQKRQRFILVGFLDREAKKFFEEIKSKKKAFLEWKGLPKAPTVKDAISDLKKANGVIECRENHNFGAGIYSKPNSRYQKVLREGYREDIPDSHRFPNHKSKTIRRFSDIMEQAERGKTISKELRKQLGTGKISITPLDGDKPSPTLTTLPDDYIHYCEPRILTVREYARLQSFKDWYKITGKYTTGGKERKYEVPRYTQVGNAIPPLFGEQAGNIFDRML